MSKNPLSVFYSYYLSHYDYAISPSLARLDGMIEENKEDYVLAEKLEKRRQWLTQPLEFDQWRLLFLRIRTPRRMFI